MIAERISHYRIISQLGAGGMGEVYLAEDTRLDRKVALKLLPAKFTEDADRVRRFIQEAKAASALNHPNIITIYEIGQEQGAHFIATEFIDGQTLRQRMASEHLSLSAALEVAMQTASALSAAHEAGIIHRDIKPENIMLRRDGYVKVLDFGLAKLIERRPDTHDTNAPTVAQVKTDPGTVMGTVRYMSPEQARGQEVDARTDVFSLGVVLYEVVAGREPFEGTTVADVLAAILKTEPLPLTRLAPGAPSELERIVAKALRKDREERYQTAKDLQLDLKSLKQEMEIAERLKGAQAPALPPPIVEAATNLMTAVRTTSSAEYLVSEIKRHKLGVALALALLVIAAVTAAYFLLAARSSTGAIKAIAVLPFANESGDQNLDYLSDGLSESLIDRLSQLPQLKVIARGSSFKYKGKVMDPQEVAKTLGVEAIITGRVIQRGESLEVRAEMVNARAGTQLWGENYHRQISDLLSVQEGIAKDIVEKLRLKLSGEEQRRLTKRHTDNVEAYQLYLRGRYHWSKLTVEELGKSVDYFQQAIALDPNYAPAYSGLADSYSALGALSALPPAEVKQKAKAAAVKALEREETLAEAHTSLARVKMEQDWDWSGADREYQRAIELNPNYSAAHYYYSINLKLLGLDQDGLGEAKRAQELDPLSLTMNYHLGRYYYWIHQYDQAITQLRKTLDLDRDYWLAHSFLGRAYEKKGMYEQAAAEASQAVKLSERHPDAIAVLGIVYAKAGKRGEALKLLEELEQRSRKSHVSPLYPGLICAGLGEKDQAFMWLEKLYEEHSQLMIYVKADPNWDDLRSDSRFQELLRKVGLTP